MLVKLFSSETRVQLLILFLTNPDARFYVREIERAIRKDVTAIRRELNSLEDIGLLVSDREGNLKYYRVNKEFFLFPELKNIIFKTEGVQGLLKNMLNDLQGVRLAFIYGSYAKGTEGRDSDVDLLIVGNIDLTKLNELVTGLEAQLAREINYTVFTEQEYRERKRKKEAFLSEVLSNQKILLVGEEDAL